MITKFYRQLFLLIVTFTLAVGVFVLPLYGYKVHLQHDCTDFSVFFRAAERVKNLQWNEIYNLQDGSSPFRYAPPLLPLFRPFAELSIHQAHLVWFFLQYLWFGLGFIFIYQSLRICIRRKARLRTVAVTCLSLLFILRFCLDSFTIGQSSSLLFLGFCLGFYFWIRQHPVKMALSLLIPTVFKIGPGFLYGVFLASHSRQRKVAAQTLGLAVMGLIAFTSTWTKLVAGSGDLAKKLWADWFQIVLNDSVYFDASHYGSQSFKSFLLRLVNWGWLSPDGANRTYLLLALLVCAGISSFWLLRRPRSLYGRGLFFAIGLFAYIWLMPETFKYSLTPLAIPVALLFALREKTPFCLFSLAFGVVTLSLGGKDIVSDSVFFGYQKHSIPLLATLFLAGAVFQLAWKHSTPSRTGQFLMQVYMTLRRNLWPKPQERLGPWEIQPSLERTLDVSMLIPVSMDLLSPSMLLLLKNHITDSISILRALVGNRFEILLIVEENGPALRDRLDAEFVKILHHPQHLPKGRGSLLRTGFLYSKGKKLLFTRPEQLGQTEFLATFFKKSLTLLDSGYDLIRANRRLADSYFKLQVKLLPLVYGRHRLGVAFNRLVRWVLPIRTTDTHSGILAVSWRLGVEAFAVQSSPGFLFDLELSLTASAHKYREEDLPMTMALGKEKSAHQIALETFDILFGLPMLAWRYRQKCYHPIPKPSGITADDWGISPGVNQGILTLAKLGVVKRVSLMANCAYLETGLRELTQIPQIELGLHLNLTYGGQQKFSSPGKFLFYWSLPFLHAFGANSKQWLRAEVASQFEALKKVGIRPQYLDGHHHIHLVPGVIDAISDLVRSEGIHKMRLPLDWSLWKTAQSPLILLSLLARSKMKYLGIQFTPCLYPPRGYFMDHGRLRRLLLSAGAQTEVIVHPAEKNDFSSLEILDEYTEERVFEFRTLRMLDANLRGKI